MKLYLLQANPRQHSPEIEMNLAPASCRSTPFDTGKIAPQNCSTPTPRFARQVSTWNLLYHAEGAYPQTCLIELPRNQIPELHVDKFHDASCFQCWKTNFKTEVCSWSVCLTVAMLWIKEVEVDKSVDDLLTSQSIEGHAFPDVEMFDAKITSALKRIITDQYFRRRINVEEQHCSKIRQISSRKTDCFFDLQAFSGHWCS